MGFYARHLLPRLVEAGMRNQAMTEHRPKLPPRARGRVLEVGMGSGLNFPYYTSAVTQLFGLEPSEHLRRAAAERAALAPCPVELIAAGAESIPLERASIDTVVTTWTLCSIGQLEPALAEIRRVLKPDGRLLFLEHGRAPDAAVARWQDRLAPIFRTLAGCNPNRPIAQLIGSAGFRFLELEEAYFDGPRFIAYHYLGQASPA